MCKDKEYGKMARIGIRFHGEVKDINKKRILKGKSEDKISIEKISNLIVKHKDFNQIKKEIIELDEEVIEEKWE